jgi:hypothetical protein
MIRKEKKMTTAGKTVVQSKGIRTENDLELLKIILDENRDLKEKVLTFMRKNYAKATTPK